MSPSSTAVRRAVVLTCAALAVTVPALLAFAGRSRYWRYIAAEDTPMTWMQSVVLVVTCVVALLVAHVVRLRGRERPLAWLVLAAGFGYLALDERFALHERIRDRILAPRGIRIPFLPWMGPGDFVMLVVALVGLSVLPMVLRALAADRASRTMLLVGVALAATAVGMDSLDPARMSLGAERLEQTLEECLELAAGLSFLGAVLLRLLSGIEDLLRAPALDRAVAPAARTLEPTTGSGATTSRDAQQV